MNPRDAQLATLDALLAAAHWQLEHSRLQLLAAQRAEARQREQCDRLEQQLRATCTHAAHPALSSEIDRASGFSGPAPALGAAPTEPKPTDPQRQMRLVQALTRLRACMSHAQQQVTQLAAQRAALQADCVAQQRRIEGLEKAFSVCQKQKQHAAQTRTEREIEQTHLARCSSTAAQAADLLEDEA